MECNCKWTETILALVIIVFAFWEVTYSMWIIIIAAVLLLIHAFRCKNCGTCMPEKGMQVSGSRKKRR
jgi:phosphatidylglycerophosphate synthase